MIDSPSHWKRCKLGNVIRLKNGYAFKSQDYADEGVPLVRISDINDEKVSTEDSVRIPKEKVNPSFYVEQGDLLIAMSGATTGKTGVYNGTVPVLQNQRVGNFKIIDEAVIDKKWRNYYVASLRKEIEKAAYGGAQPNISAKGIEDFDFPLAPLAEQKLIVAEIEKQFSRLDEAVANLKRIKANLKRYKAAVLKAAVEGKLTEAWRKKNPDVEPASKLLDRILTARRAKWKGKGKYKEPVAQDTTDLPELPEGWVWASLEQACVKITDGTHHSPKNFSHGEYKYITSKNVREFRLDLKDLTYVDKAIHDEIYSRCDVKKYDVLYVKDGVNTGLAATNTLDEPFSLLSSVGVFRTVEQLLPDFLVIYLNSSEVRDRMLANIAGVAITRLTLNKLKATLIAIPPPIEQAQIVTEAQRRLSIIDRIGITIGANLTRADRLRQAFLGKAFSGQLHFQGKTEMLLTPGPTNEACSKAQE